jgi:hypothetical protein
MSALSVTPNQFELSVAQPAASAFVSNAQLTKW